MLTPIVLGSAVTKVILAAHPVAVVFISAMGVLLMPDHDKKRKAQLRGYEVVGKFSELKDKEVGKVVKRERGYL